MIILPEDCRRLYEPLRLLATGGFGAAVLCRQLSLDRQTVIKILHADGLASKEQVERFKAEATITSRLQHPNIVRVLDFGFGMGVPWISYEFLEGRTVYALIENGPLSPREVLDLGRQVASALDHAHQLEILHRDIKSANVIKADDGSFKVIDFGIAQWSSNSAVKTATGIIYGSPEAMPPEYIREGKFVRASDIYSLGVLLFQASTGRLPFEAENPTQLLSDHLGTIAPSLRSVDPAIPVPLDRLVARMLAKNPIRRFGSCRELVEAIDTATGDGPEPGEAAGDPSVEEPRRLSSQRRRLSSSVPAITRANPARLLVEESSAAIPAPTVPPGESRRGWIVFALAVIALAALVPAYRAFRPGEEPSSGPSAVSAPGPRLQLAFLPGSRTLSVSSGEVQEETSVTVSTRSGKIVGKGAGVPGRALEITSIPPGVELVVEARRADGTLIGPVPVTSPPLLRLGRVRVFPDGRQALVDFDLEGPAGVQVKLRRAEGAGGESLAVQSAGRSYFHHWFKSLTPETEYVIQITHPGAMGGLTGLRFRTKAPRRRSVLEEYRSLMNNDGTFEVMAVIEGLQNSQDPSSLDIVRDYLVGGVKGARDEMSDISIQGGIRQFRERELAMEMVPDPDAWLKGKEASASSSAALRDAAFLLGARHPGFDPVNHLPSRIGGMVDAVHERRLERFLQCCDPGTGTPLLDRLASWCENDDAHSWKDAVVEAMARIDLARSADHFRRWLQGSTRGELKRLALLGLALTGQDSDVTSIKNVTTSHAGKAPGGELVAAVIEALARIDSTDARRALVEILPVAGDRKSLVWTAARLGLGELTPYFEDWFGDSISRNKKSASTDPLGFGQVIGTLVSSLETDRVEMVYAVGMIASPEKLAEIDLLRFLRSREERLALARAAGWTLAFRGVTAAGTSIVKELLDHDDTGVAIWAVGELRVAEARSALVRIVRQLEGKDGDEEQVRLGLASWALGRLPGNPEKGLLERVRDTEANQSFARQLAGEAVVGEEVPPGESRYFLFPFIPFVRTGLRLPREEVLAVEVIGKWGISGREFAAGSGFEDPVGSGVPLRASMLRGRHVVSLRDLAGPGHPCDPFASPDSEIVLSPYHARIHDVKLFPTGDLRGVIQVRLRRPSR